MVTVMVVVVAVERAGTKHRPRDRHLHQQPYPVGPAAHPGAGQESTNWLSTFVGNVGTQNILLPS